MRLRDRFRAALQTFREAPDLQSRLTTAEYQRSLADQVLELRERECADLRGTIEEKDFRLRFLGAKSAALTSALKEFSPKLSSTEEMKHFYNTVSCTLDPDGFTMHRVAEKLTGVDTVSLFPYENAHGAFETASGRELMKYLTAYCFDAVQWESVPDGAYKKAVLSEVNTTTPEYQRFERQLYESVLERMGFDELLAPKQAEPAPVFTVQFANTMSM